MTHRSIEIFLDGVLLNGELTTPEQCRGIVVFAHGSGSSRMSPRNQFVAEQLHRLGIGTLLFDLLTEAEDQDRRARFDIQLLARRLLDVTAWLEKQREAAELPVGYFGASTGAAAALKAAAALGPMIKAVVSRGGRPDLAGDDLKKVRSPTLLIVGGDDTDGIHLNEAALRRIDARKELVIIPGAGHLFEEPGTLARAAEYAARWFLEYLDRNQFRSEAPFL